MSDVLQLENFVFQDLEVPSRICLGGEQMTAVHTLIGGVRVIDTLGRDDKALEWSGYFLGGGIDSTGAQTGVSAVQRARYLDQLRVAGQAIALTWGEFSYQVIVKRFDYEYEAPFRIPYRICCEVIADNTSVQASNDAQPSIDDAVQADFGSIGTLVGQVNDNGLIAALNTLTAAINAVTTFASAAQSTVNSVLAPLNALRVTAQALASSNDLVLAGAVGFAGIVAGADPSAMIAAFQQQQLALSNLTACLQVSNLCGRMAKNLAAVNASETTITIGGGDLYTIASQEYGDATEWTTLAKANGLTSPFITGPATLTVPSTLDGQDGVLNP